MIKKINRTEAIKSSLREQGKITIINTQIQQAAISKLNEEMKEVKRDYKMKERKSETSASYVCLTD